MHPLIPVHVLGGAVALLAGFAVLALRKGGWVHAWLGTAFFASILVMAGTGSIIALAMPERGTAAVGVLTCYLVTTSWMTARRRSGRAGGFELVSFLVASACSAAFLAIAAAGLAQPSGRLDLLPAPVHFPFAALAALAAGLDLNFLLRKEIAAKQRILRHLWRMAAALLIAAMSFFLGQQKVMPEAIRGSPLLLLPVVFAAGSLAFWVLRVRFAKRWRVPRRQRFAEA